MAEYIERETALQLLNRNSITKKITLADGVSIYDTIKNMPAADVVEVIRCSECQHWGGVVFGNVCKRWSAPLAGMKNCTQPDDFCNYGERRLDNG